MLKELIVAAGLTSESARCLVGVSPRTWRRYLNGTAKPPTLLVQLLEARRDLAVMEPAFKGWRFACGELVSPEGLRWTPPQLYAADFICRNAAVIRGDYRAMVEKLERLEAENTRLRELGSYGAVAAVVVLTEDGRTVALRPVAVSA